jgi:hypothetical protein
MKKGHTVLRNVVINTLYRIILVCEFRGDKVGAVLGTRGEEENFVKREREKLKMRDYKED